jgi:hypothetical protein
LQPLAEYFSFWLTPKLLSWKNFLFRFNFQRILLYFNKNLVDIAKRRTFAPSISRLGDKSFGRLGTIPQDNPSNFPKRPNDKITK